MKKGVDYIGVGVGAVIFSPDGKIFLAKRGKEAGNESGKWEFPGGGVEFNETLEHALMREVTEEYGFAIVHRKAQRRECEYFIYCSPSTVQTHSLADVATSLQVHTDVL